MGADMYFERIHGIADHTGCVKHAQEAFEAGVSGLFVSYEAWQRALKREREEQERRKRIADTKRDIENMQRKLAEMQSGG